MKQEVFIYQHPESFMHGQVEFRAKALSEVEQISQHLVLIGSAFVEFDAKSCEQLEQRMEAMRADSLEATKNALRKQLEELEAQDTKAAQRLRGIPASNAPIFAQICSRAFFKGRVMNNQFEQAFAEQFSDMAEVAKPLNAAELKTKVDFERGVLDAMAGVPHKDDQSEAYEQGYASVGEE